MGRCQVCKKPAKNKCSRCTEVYYCSRDCQREDYPEHKGKCHEKIYTLEKTLYTGFGIFAKGRITPGTRVLTDTSILTVNTGSTFPEVHTDIALWVPETPGQTPSERFATAIKTFGTMVAPGKYMVFPKLRNVNHSCHPNARMSAPNKDGTVHITAIKGIRPKEEITVSYIPTSYCSIEARKKDLPFECRCKECRECDPTDEDFKTKFTVTLGIILTGPGMPVQQEILYLDNCLDACQLIAGGPRLDYLTETVLSLYIKRFLRRSKESESFRRDIREKLIFALECAIRVSKTIGNEHTCLYQQYTKCLAEIAALIEPLPAA